MERGLPEAEKRGVLRLLAILGAAVVGLSVIFGFTILRNHSVFRDYQAATLEDGDAPPPWDTEALSVDDCVEETVRWTMECPGIASWCLAEVPVVAERCLASRDRTAYCEEVGDEVMSTRFGFHACEDLRAGMDDDDEKYAKRANKKYCAATYRAVAEHCLSLRGLK